MSSNRQSIKMEFNEYFEYELKIILIPFSDSVLCLICPHFRSFFKQTKERKDEKVLKKTLKKKISDEKIKRS